MERKGEKIIMPLFVLPSEGATMRGFGLPEQDAAEDDM